MQATLTSGGCPVRSAGDVRSMDAAVKPTWMYSRRPRKSVPGSHRGFPALNPPTWVLYIYTVNCAAANDL
ncbi:hypothetical protein GCM10007392_41970 [Saccharospirillum salsuginis]|uniref:Uncharacterized protein n=1 Tax=Saccharospirillum salsuginis TaxID=418750 RepID=A0A918NFW6_9GAMM|nr:hypothetical protein GCM10007392_41970 [Saccharospirillum salsuginis]